MKIIKYKKFFYNYLSRVTYVQIKYIDDNGIHLIYENKVGVNYEVQRFFDRDNKLIRMIYASFNRVKVTIKPNDAIIYCDFDKYLDLISCAK